MMQNKIINTSWRDLTINCRDEAVALAEASNDDKLRYEYIAIAFYNTTAEALAVALDASKAYEAEANNYSYTDAIKDTFTAWAEVSEALGFNNAKADYKNNFNNGLMPSVLAECRMNAYYKHLKIEANDTEAFTDKNLDYSYLIFSNYVTDKLNKLYDASQDKKAKAKAKVSANAYKANNDYFFNTFSYECNHKSQHTFMLNIYDASGKYHMINYIVKAKNYE